MTTNVVTQQDVAPEIGEAPLFSQPDAAIFECARKVETPAVIYDTPGIRDTVRRMQHDMNILPCGRLNVALKACHTPALLSFLANTGVGCDVASIGELRLAQEAGFHEITATGPAFSTADFAAFRNAGIVPDIDSPSQLRAYGSAFPGEEVGLRVRVPLPRKAQTSSTFALDSRFGVRVTEDAVWELLRTHRLRVTRLHVHTGQTTPQTLLFKVRYLLMLAERLPEVHTIDLGGGLFHLYVDRAKATAALRRAAGQIQEWRQRTGRELQFRVEPGGAVLAAYGYLTTEVRSVEEEHPTLGCRIVTVDSSAWNLAPWHKPQAVPLYAAHTPAERVLIAGNTLYENDFFGLDVTGKQHPMTLPPPAPGDRILLTAAGAYTMTNSRRFNRIPPPREYLFDGREVTAVEHVDG